MHDILRTALLVLATFVFWLSVQHATQNSVRKCIHITVGPIYYLSICRIQFSLATALLASMIQLAAASVFILARKLRIQPILSLIQRGSGTQIVGVIEYAVLWALLPLAMLFGGGEDLRCGLFCLSAGDGFAGFGGALSRRTGKTLCGSVLFFLSSLAALTLVGEHMIRGTVLSALGVVVEIYTTNQHDNVAIVCSITLCSWYMRRLGI
ncbi:Transmembrane domain-containing protein [Spironucleus salmonicida]|uniref:Transmembrane domain-containing protein n=1 Tax=Spironucleus salmonicida TaxID=348837 RepID=V6LQ04_9EUKA|nr:Transmembrane domain-containing protein [Spironucleus salmonicida]|eukprot:EST46328.1 Transmembrane domain-containing protein [Spironucleus salmonicida]